MLINGKEEVDHPPHYTSHPSGVECIDITEHMGFNLGNALKYIWRCDLKGAGPQDLRKAMWYINREINRIERGNINREANRRKRGNTGDISKEPHNQVSKKPTGM